MPYNEALETRIRSFLDHERIPFEAKKMMGGLTFIVNHKMCTGIFKDDLMVRVAQDQCPDLLTRRGCREMDFTGKPMKGFLLISPDGLHQDHDLEFWLRTALDYNQQIYMNS